MISVTKQHIYAYKCLGKKPSFHTVFGGKNNSEKITENGKKH